MPKKKGRKVRIGTSQVHKPGAPTEEMLEALNELAEDWMRRPNQWEYIIGTKISVELQENYAKSVKKSVSQIVAAAKKEAQHEMALAAADFMEEFADHWAENWAEP
jgi:hypothetical protein